ncbi:MAG: hypothetical protein P8M22_06300 [Phycisphaerales bacterium]|nr:hypothetical protein [Phycisphaerales bacterium]
MTDDLLTWHQLPPVPDRVDEPWVGFDWNYWESLLKTRRVVIDRPRKTAHPDHPAIIYPIDYGHLPGTKGGDGVEVDVWSGSGHCGLVGVILTQDHVKKDREVDLLWNCTPQEIYLVNGFINFDRELLEGQLLLRHAMLKLWSQVDSS